MFDFLFKKQKVIEQYLHEYLQAIEIAKQNFLHAMDTYVETGRCCPDFEFLVEETHKAESRGDDIQERLISTLFKKALVPEFRGDVLTLLELIDNVPDQFDRVLYAIQTQGIELHDDVKKDFKELVAVSQETCTLMLHGLKDFFKHPTTVDEILSQMDQLESRGDHIERRIITSIFKSDLEPLQKILGRDLISMMGDIADYAVHVWRQVHLITIKRQV